MDKYVIKRENKDECTEDSYEIANVIPLKPTWKYIVRENLSLHYCQAFTPKSASALFVNLEKEVEYFSGELSRVKVFGKWHDIPRKQVGVKSC